MSYTETHDILLGLKDALEGLGVFNGVAVSDGTGASQLLQELEQARPPCAVVGMGSVQYDDEGLRRTVRPVVLAVDVFRRGGESRAGGAWGLAGEVRRMLSAGLEAHGGGWPGVQGVELSVASEDAVDAGGSLAAVLVTLEGVEFY